MKKIVKLVAIIGVALLIACVTIDGIRHTVNEMKIDEVINNMSNEEIAECYVEEFCDPSTYGYYTVSTVKVYYGEDTEGPSHDMMVIKFFVGNKIVDSEMFMTRSYVDHMINARNS